MTKPPDAVLLFSCIKGLFDDCSFLLVQLSCTVIQAFVLVVLPLITQALVATAIFSWIQAWNEYLFALTVTRSNARTIIVAVNNYINFEQMQWGKIAATSVIISLPVMVFSFFVRKYLISGLSAGGVKA